MKISETIKRFEELKASYGDLDVLLIDGINDEYIETEEYSFDVEFPFDTQLEFPVVIIG